MSCTECLHYVDQLWLSYSSDYTWQLCKIIWCRRKQKLKNIRDMMGKFTVDMLEVVTGRYRKTGLLYTCQLIRILWRLTYQWEKYGVNGIILLQQSGILIASAVNNSNIDTNRHIRETGQVIVWGQFNCLSCTYLYSWVIWGVVEITKLPRFETAAKAIRPMAISIASSCLWHYITQRPLSTLIIVVV